MTIRLGGIIVGLGLTAVLLLWSLLPGTVALYTDGFPEKPDYYAFQEENISPEGGFSFEGATGTWDIAQLQRGYQVYKEVCASCHSLKFVAFRNLQELTYSDAEVRAEAASWQVPGIDQKDGSAITRPGLPTDQFPSPYANEVEARAFNNNAIPPDLSLMAKARPDGTNYIYSLMQGYGEPDPADQALSPEFETPQGLYFNEHFYNINIAMPPQLTPGIVTYSDGTEATTEQMSADIAAFLTWTAEPSLVQRKQTGWFVLGFLLFATFLAFMSYKQIWAGMKPKK
ncbi:cytochrome c1 [Erythrobacter sp. Alg231-14]|uniref:cytochrome c1 n=1 Tax=Erythrobacter sp. Alg231-14 TaxID=1922225 RepID=UPI000D55F1EC